MQGFVYGVLFSLVVDAVAAFIIFRSPTLRFRLKAAIRNFLGIDRLELGVHRLQEQLGQIHYSVHRIEDATCPQEDDEVEQDNESYSRYS